MADEASRKAVELDDSLPETHTARAFASTIGWKWDEAESEFRRALELNPNSASTNYFYGFSFLLPENRIDEALKELRTALSLDPLSSIVATNYATTLMTAHRYPEALEEFRKVLQREPGFQPAHHKLSQLYATMGRFGDAVREIQKTTPNPGSWNSDASGYSKLAIASSGQGVNNLSAVVVGLVLAGDRDKALHYLENACSDHDTELILFIRYPALDAIRSDPRYADLMRRIGLPQ